VDYGFLAEFDVLRLTVSDKCHEGWTKPANREAAVKYFKLRRAREEVEWLNLEIYRLEHSIRTETKQMSQALEALRATPEDAPLVAELEHRRKLRASVDTIHRQRFVELKSKPYFTGRISDDPPTPAAEAAELNEDLTDEDREIEIATDFVVDLSNYPV